MIGLARLRRLAGPLILGLAALAIAGLMWAAGRHDRVAQAEQAARARGVAELARAGEVASSAAATAVADLGEREMSRQAQERNTHDDILSAPDAGASAGASGDAGLAGLCQRALYRDHPRCAGLRQPDSTAIAR